MNYLRVLQTRRSALMSQAGLIYSAAESENRGLSAEDRANDDRLRAEVQEVSADITRYEAHTAAAKELKPLDVISGGDKPGQPAAKGGFTSFGEQLMAVAAAARNPGQLDPRLLQAAGAGATESVTSDGSFLIQPEYAQDVLAKSYASGLLLSRCRKVPLSDTTNSMKINAVKENSRVNGSRWGGVVVNWADEGTTAPSSKPQFRQIELNLKKLLGIAYATDEMLADATTLGAMITEAFASEMTFKLEDAIINGTGVGQPLGVIASGSMIVQNIETSQTIANSNQFLIFNMAKMWSRLYPPSMENAAWFINVELIPYLFNMTLGGTAASQPIFMPPGGVSGSPYASVYGKPVIPIEQASGVGTTGDIILADLSQYLLTDKKAGLQSASSVHVRFLTDEMTYRFTYRVDGTPAWNSPLTPYKGTNTQSPFVALNTRT